MKSVYKEHGISEVGEFLYVTSDENIKEGDWYIEMYRGMVVCQLLEDSVMFDANKIIATNDPSLTFERNFICPMCDMDISNHYDYACGISDCPVRDLKIPQIPESFIESYAKGSVDKVGVEYFYRYSEKVCKNESPYFPNCHAINSYVGPCGCGEYIQKITSNNEVSIKESL